MEQDQLTTYLNKYLSFEQYEIDTFKNFLTLKSYAKKDFLLKHGDFNHYRYFILQGLTRSYYIDPDGKERIVQFALENWWLTDMESFVTQSVSKINIQALEETQVLMISKSNLEKLFAQHPKFERLFRMLSENMIIALQRHTGLYMKENKQQRYETVRDLIPDFLQRVPQYMVASYLDIAPEYLSELRKKSRS
ncbi:MAG: Crp/Fnr family transcriptional regulator [Reichenbachiella sp.]